ncbi:S41 family peptidase [Alphaproteobacteria bacterium]|nr:S41 family peptidase [Alphaproteobacteria bacterium]
MSKLYTTLTIFLITLLLSNPSTAAGKNSETYKKLNFFGEVFERVRSTYVDEVSDDKLIDAAINGMLQSLDPHSAYLNPKNFKEMQVQTRGEFGGLGIEVTMENGYVKVIAPIDDTPAFKAGIQTNDLITHINGESVQGLSLSQAVEKMRGPVNSSINLTIARQKTGKSFDVKIIRKVIKIASVKGQIDEKIIYLRITSFSEQTTSGLKKQMSKLFKESEDKPIGVILDLRGNPGGLLSQAVLVSDAFLDKGEIVSTRGRDENESQRYNAKRGDISNKLPIVVLINGGSASASEIVAGALQDHKRAIILGTKSFGKGSVQTIIPISGNGALRLTTSLYYTPSGRSIQAKGITPDIIVEQAKLENINTPFNNKNESNLRNHIQSNKIENDEQTKNDENNDTKPFDFQLVRAKDLLNGLYFFNKER